MRTFERFMSCGLALAPLALCLCSGTSQAHPSVDGGSLLPPLQPQRQRFPEMGEFNVLVIVLDDTGTDQLKMYAEDAGPPSHCATAQLNAVRTPFLDEMRADGVLYSRYYVNPTCSPTRAAVLTGRLGRRTGVGLMINKGSSAFGLPNAEVTLPEVLRVLNPTYRRGAFGKWHLTKYEGDDCHPIQNGFEVFKGIHGNPESHFSWRKTTATGDGSSCGSSGSASEPGTEGLTPEEYFWDAGVARADAANWINGLGAAPFFAYVCFSPPHIPWEAPPFETLSALTATRLSLAGIECGATRTGERPLETLIYRANIEAIDYEIRQLVESIPAGVLAKTMIFVMGDNGTVGDLINDPDQIGLSGHGKRTVFELGTRAPLIVSGPLVVPSAMGGTCRNLVSAVDMWRTLANVTGLTNAVIDAHMAGTTIDSRTFFASFANPGTSPTRSTAYFESFPNGLPLATTNFQRGITNGTYRYKYGVDNQGNPVPGSLFNTQATPCELENNDLLNQTLAGADLAAYNQLVAALNAL